MALSELSGLGKVSGKYSNAILKGTVPHGQQADKLNPYNQWIKREVNEIAAPAADWITLDSSEVHWTPGFIEFKLLLTIES